MLKLMLIFDIFRITIQIQDLSLKKNRKKTFTIFNIGSALPSLQPSMKFLVGIFGVPFTFQFVHQISIAYTPSLLNFDNSFFFIIVIFFIFYHLGEDDGSKF